MASVNGKNVFLSGPMSGLDFCNVAEFAKAHARIKELGAQKVYDPAIAYLEDLSKADEKPHDWWMLKCLRELCGVTDRDPWDDERRYDVLVLLDGWRDSDGACTEREVALSIGMEVRELSEVV